MLPEAFLLDTNSFLWWQTLDEHLPARLRALLNDPANEVFVSAVTCIEIVMKYRLGKLVQAADFASDIKRVVLNSGFTPLDIGFDAGQLSAELPPFHKDPFDRLLIAQALLKDLTVISSDQLFDRYGVRRLWR